MKKIIGIILSILLITLIGCKVGTLVKYGVHEEESKICGEALTKIWIKQNSFTIENKNEDDNYNDYLIYENMKIKVAGKSQKQEKISDEYEIYTMDIDEKNDNVQKIVMLGRQDTIFKTIEEMKQLKEDSSFVDDLYKIIKDKNITNDVEAIKYLYSKKGNNMRSNIFTSSKKMKEDMLVYIFSEYYMNNQYVVSGNGITLIDGNYIGYMASTEKNGNNITYVGISKDEYVYEVVFTNFEENEILEAINTIIIE